MKCFGQGLYGGGFLRVLVLPLEFVLELVLFTIGILCLWVHLFFRRALLADGLFVLMKS